MNKLVLVLAQVRQNGESSLRNSVIRVRVQGFGCASRWRGRLAPCAPARLYTLFPLFLDSRSGSFTENESPQSAAHQDKNREWNVSKQQWNRVNLSNSGNPKLQTSPFGRPASWLRVQAVGLAATLLVRSFLVNLIIFEVLKLILAGSLGSICVEGRAASV